MGRRGLIRLMVLGTALALLALGAGAAQASVQRVTVYRATLPGRLYG